MINAAQLSKFICGRICLALFPIANRGNVDIQALCNAFLRKATINPRRLQRQLHIFTPFSRVLFNLTT